LINAKNTPGSPKLILNEKTAGYGRQDGVGRLIKLQTC
jgi:hypothetical protein